MVLLCDLGGLARIKYLAKRCSSLAKSLRTQRLRKGLARSEQVMSKVIKGIKALATLAAWREKKQLATVVLLYSFCAKRAIASISREKPLQKT